jgi:hypothetical protein
MRNARTAKNVADKIRGTYILEAAFVCFGVATVAVAVHDVASIFRARNTVRAAVREGLRCMYPTDANCASVNQISSAPQEKRYDVWAKKFGYFIPQKAFSVRSQWTDQPKLSVQVEETLLASLTVQTPPTAVQKSRVTVPTELNAMYLLQTSDLPQIVGNDVRKPRFQDASKETQAPTVKVSLVDQVKLADNANVAPKDAVLTENLHEAAYFSVRALSDSAKQAVDLRSKSALLRAKLPGASLACYRGGYEPCMIGGLNDAVKDTKVVTNQLSSVEKGAASGLKVPVFLWITGSSIKSDRSAEGKVTLTYQIDSGAEIDLGGQRIDGNPRGVDIEDESDAVDMSGGEDNFVVRGVNYDDIAENSQLAYKNYRPDDKSSNEIEKYGTWIWVPDGSTVKVNFRISSTNGKPIAWQGYHLFAFHPTFEFRHDKHDCGYSGSPAHCENMPQSLPPSFYIERGSGAPKLQPIGAVECHDYMPQSGVVSLEKANETLALRADAANAQWPIEYRQEVDAGLCPMPPKRSFDCNNRLVGEKFTGCGESSSANNLTADQAFDICNVPQELRSDKSVVGRTLKTQTATREYLGCSEKPAIPECANRDEVGRVVWFPKNEEEREACKLDQDKSTEPMIVGPVDDNICKDLVAQAQDAYRGGVREPLPAGAPIIVESIPVVPAERHAGPTRPAECFAATEKEGEALCGKKLTQAAAEKCCSDASGKCRMDETVATYAVDGINYGSGIEGARERALDMIKNTYPSLRTDGFDSEGGCDGSAACLASLQGNFTQDNTRARLAARIQLPLLTTSLLQDAPYTVEHQEERILERALVE